MASSGSKDHSACSFCHYDLAGNTSGICPECGTPVGDSRPPRALDIRVAPCKYCGYDATGTLGGLCPKCGNPELGTPLCVQCGYDMTGNTSGVCPECGKAVFRFPEPILALFPEANGHAVAMLRGESVYQPQAPARGRSTAPTVILPRHLLMSICNGPSTMAQKAIVYWGVEPMRLCRTIGRRVPVSFPEPIAAGARLPIDSSCRVLVAGACQHAAALGHGRAGPEHLLLALFDGIIVDGADRFIRASFQECKLTRDNVRWYVIEYTKRAEAAAAADPFSEPQLRRGMRRPPRCE